MPDTAIAPACPPCVWMEAGVIDYRLCNRGFDCEHCLLDAALRAPAGPPDPAPAEPLRSDTLAPGTRFYTAGHAWLQPVADAAVWRFGVDAFAAALLGHVNGIRCAEPGRSLGAGDSACRIDLDAGTLSIEAPVPCRVLRPNSALAGRPEMVIRDPYDAGWILELAITDPAGLLGLSSPTEARMTIERDLSRFTRSLAIDLIAGVPAPGRAALLAGRFLTDVPALIGPTRYLELLQELLH